MAQINEKQYHGISFDLGVGLGSHEALLKVNCWGYSRSLNLTKCFNASNGVRVCNTAIIGGRFGKVDMLDGPCFGKLLHIKLAEYRCVSTEFLANGGRRLVKGGMMIGNI